MVDRTLFGALLSLLPVMAAIYWLYSRASRRSLQNAVTRLESTTCEVLVPSKAVGHVIGRSGSNIRQIEETTSTRIRLKDQPACDDKRVVIRGKTEDVSRAKAAIESTIETKLNADNLKSVTITIPKKDVGRIIGKQGANIRKMQSETGAQISIDKLSSANERFCVIRGNDEQLQKAQQLLKETLSNTSPEDEEQEVIVPVGSVGRIIGRQGTNIRQLQLESGARIHYDRHCSNESGAKFIVRGTVEQQEKAKSLLLDMLHDFRIGRVQRQSKCEDDQMFALAKSELPETTEYFSVFVSAVDENGYVWMQRISKTSNELDELVDTMTADYERANERLTQVAVGTVCAAPFGMEGSWYRGIVERLDTVQGTVLIRYVDFGDTSELELAKLKPLRPEYCQIPTQAICCALPNVELKSTWSDVAVKDLHRLTLCSSWKPIIASVINISSVPPVVQLIDTTTDKDIDIASEMVKLGHMEWIQKRPDTAEPLGHMEWIQRRADRTAPIDHTESSHKPAADYTNSEVSLLLPVDHLSLPPEHMEFTAFVTSVQSPDLLFIQLDGYQMQLEAMTEKMTKVYTAMHTTATFAVGDLVAASFLHDELWYRAQVVSHVPGEDGVLLLRYLDYGDYHHVPVEFIRPLPQELAEGYPAFAVPCCLADVVPVGHVWDPKATEFVQDHTNAGEWRPLLSVVSGHRETACGRLPAVTLSFMSEAYSVNKLLIAAGLAASEDNRKHIAITLTQQEFNNFISSTQELMPVLAEDCDEETQ